MLMHDSTAEPWESIAAFKTSPLHEMLISLENLTYPVAPRDRVAAVSEALGHGFIDELKSLYAQFNHGVILAELAFSRDDHDDVPAFLDWVEGLSDVDFTWYVLGRVPDRSAIPEPVTREAIEAIIEGMDAEFCSSWYIDFTWAEDVGALRTHLVALWRAFWDVVFRHEVEKCRPLWDESIQRRSRQLHSDGFSALLEDLCGKKGLPDPYPEGVNYETLEMIPITRMSRRLSKSSSVCFFGWGKVSILYDITANKEDLQRRETLQADLLVRFKALCDEKRLKILHLIAMNEQVVNGKWLATTMDLSPSVISRHLSQLRKAGFIKEHTSDNRNYTYSLVNDQIGSISPLLDEYLRQTFSDS